MSMPKYLEDWKEKIFKRGRIDYAQVNNAVDNRWNSHFFAVITYEKDGKVKKVRAVPNMISLNRGLISPPTTLPLNKSMLQNCSAGMLFAEIDLETTFLQLSLDSSSRHKTAFTWPPNSNIRYEFFGAPWGLTFLYGTKQRALEAILEGLTFIIVFVDNVLIISFNDWNVHFAHIAEVMTTFSKDELLQRKIWVSCHE